MQRERPDRSRPTLAVAASERRRGAARDCSNCAATRASRGERRPAGGLQAHDRPRHESEVRRRRRDARARAHRRRRRDPAGRASGGSRGGRSRRTRSTSRWRRTAPRRRRCRRATTCSSTLPATQSAPARTIAAQTLDGTGEPGNGLTGAHFTGNVAVPRARRRRRPRGARSARARRGAGARLRRDRGRDVHARRAVRGRPMAATSAAGALRTRQRARSQLSGAEPGSLRPHVVNEQIAVDAARIDVTLDGRAEGGRRR